MKKLKTKRKPLKARDIGNYAVFIGPTMVLFTLLFLIPLVSEIFILLPTGTELIPLLNLWVLKTILEPLRTRPIGHLSGLLLSFPLTLLLFLI